MDDSQDLHIKLLFNGQQFPIKSTSWSDVLNVCHAVLFAHDLPPSRLENLFYVDEKHEAVNIADEIGFLEALRWTQAGYGQEPNTLLLQFGDGEEEEGWTRVETPLLVENEKPCSSSSVVWEDSAATAVAVAVPVDAFYESGTPGQVVFENYDAMLVLHGASPKFYKFQVIQEEGQGVLFTRWGRVGQPGQQQVERFSRVEEACAQFALQFFAKTQNAWPVKEFVPVTNFYECLEVPKSMDAKKEVVETHDDTQTPEEAPRVTEEATQEAPRVIEEVTQEAPRVIEEAPQEAPLVSQFEENELVVHDQIACNSCSMSSIRGIRYQSVVLPEVNLCQACEALNLSEAFSPFVKIRTPEMALQYIVSDKTQSEMAQSFAAFCAKQVEEEHQHHQHLLDEEEDLVSLPQSKFVSDVTIPDGSPVLAKSHVEKVWRVLNSGKKVWPAGTRLVHVGGSHDLNTPSGGGMLSLLPQPGSLINISVELTMPDEPGRYTSYWRLSTAEGVPFGHRFWVTVQVVNPNSTTSGTSSRHYPGVVLQPPPCITTTTSTTTKEESGRTGFEGVVLTPPPPVVEEVDEDVNRKLGQMMDLGLFDVEENLRVLELEEGDVGRAVNRLLGGEEEGEEV